MTPRDKYVKATLERWPDPNSAVDPNVPLTAPAPVHVQGRTGRGGGFSGGGYGIGRGGTAGALGNGHPGGQGGQ
jgi:hypothetical protein